MNHNDAMNDIGTALMRLRTAFQKHNIPEPNILRWDDPQDAGEAKRALYSVAAANNEIWSYRIAVHSDSYDDQIAGFKFEWV